MKLFSLMLVSLLVCEGASFAGQAIPATESSQVRTKETPQPAKIKANVERRGIGERSRVRVKLLNGAEVKGYISKIEEASFTVTDRKTNRTTNIPYADVQKVRGPGWSKTGTIALVAVGAGVLAVSLFGYCVGTHSC